MIGVPLKEQIAARLRVPLKRALRKNGILVPEAIQYDFKLLKIYAQHHKVMPYPKLP